MAFDVPEPPPLPVARRRGATHEDILSLITTRTGPPMLEGERIISQVAMCRDVTHEASSGGAMGTLFLTNYKVVWVPEELSSYDDAVNKTVHIPLGMVNRVEKVAKRGSKDYSIELSCKEFRRARFAFPNKRNVRKAFVEEIKRYAFPGMNQCVFAFFHKPHATAAPGIRPPVVDYDAWRRYDPVAEFARFGAIDRGEKWRLTYINRNYELCETYPAVLCLPATFPEHNAAAVAQFRTKNRLPVLSWKHPHSDAAMMRSAQPKTGVKRARSSADEMMLRAMHQVNPGSNTVYIFDCRPRANALANQAMGAGSELMHNYDHCVLEYLNIENIHVMRDSLRRLRDLCSATSGDDEHYLSALEGTRWLHNLHTVVAGAVRAATVLDKTGSSCLVHCSDGWDRTSQICALVQIMLDPFYRTIDGFVVLVEKEWLSMGHRFAIRIGHADKHHSNEQRSPTFLQFVDCVWQMMSQFPLIFQFNDHFLKTVLDHLYSCRFGTFLFNTDRDRRSADLARRTRSLWDYVNSNRKLFVNPMFQPRERPAFPKSRVRDMQLWTSYYMRWNESELSIAETEDAHEALPSAYTDLKSRVDELESSIRAPVGVVDAANSPGLPGVAVIGRAADADARVSVTSQDEDEDEEDDSSAMNIVADESLVTDLQDLVDAQRSTIDVLEAELAAARSGSTMQSVIDEQRVEIDALRAKLAAESVVPEMEETITSQAAQIELLERQMAEIAESDLGETVIRLTDALEATKRELAVAREVESKVVSEMVRRSTVDMRPPRPADATAEEEEEEEEEQQ